MHTLCPTALSADWFSTQWVPVLPNSDPHTGPINFTQGFKVKLTPDALFKTVNNQQADDTCTR